MGRGPAPGHAGLPQPRTSRLEHRHHRRARRRGQLRRPAAPPGRGPVRAGPRIRRGRARALGRLGRRRRGQVPADRPVGRPGQAAPAPAPRQVLRRGRLSAVPAFAAGPPVPDPGRLVAAGRGAGRQVRRRGVRAGRRHRRRGRVPAEPAGPGRRIRPRPGPGPGPARPALPHRGHRGRGRLAEGRTGGGGQRRVPLAERGPPGRAGLHHHRPRRAVPAGAAGQRAQDQLRRRHLHDGGRRTGRHVPGRGPAPVRAARRTRFHRHAGGPGPAHDRLVPGRRRRRVHHHAQRAARPADRLRRPRGPHPATQRRRPHRVHRGDAARPRRPAPAGRSLARPARSRAQFTSAVRSVTVVACWNS